MKKTLISVVCILLFSCSSDNGGDDIPPNNNPQNDENVAPTVPTLVSPIDDLLCVDNELLFDWNSSSDSNGDSITYELQVSEDINFTTINFTITKNTTSHTFTLEKGLAYYWRVRAIDSEDATSSFSTVYSLYTEGEGISNHLPFLPELISPVLDSSNSGTEITLEWNGSDVDNDALTYDVYFGLENPPVISIAENISETNIITSVSPTNTYYWRVVVSDDKGGRTEGRIWSFEVE